MTMKNRNQIAGLVAMACLIGEVSAEVTSFRFGDSIQWLQSNLGFGVLDITLAIFDLAKILLLIIIVYWVIKWLIR